ncbi:MAG: hypothetical protein NHB14_00120 [Desulfosporosinus sp.]|nr:hypothetical protein [Desulfosporosinus sp.]
MMRISGISGASSMPRNCGMKGMHGDSQNSQVLKADERATEQQTKQPIELLKVSEENKIDIRI